MMWNFIKHIHIKQRSPFQTHLCKVLVPEEQAEWSEGCKDQHRRDGLVQPRHRLKVKVVCYISQVICTRSTAVKYCQGIVRVMLGYCQVFKRIPGRTVSLHGFKKIPGHCQVLLEKNTWPPTKPVSLCGMKVSTLSALGSSLDRGKVSPIVQWWMLTPTVTQYLAVFFKKNAIPCIEM